MSINRFFSLVGAEFGGKPPHLTQYISSRSHFSPTTLPPPTLPFFSASQLSHLVFIEWYSHNRSFSTLLHLPSSCRFFSGNAPPHVDIITISVFILCIDILCRSTISPELSFNPTSTRNSPPHRFSDKKKQQIFPLFSHSSPHSPINVNISPHPLHLTSPPPSFFFLFFL